MSGLFSALRGAISRDGGHRLPVVGKTISFGAYPQEGARRKTAIRWVVLDVRDDRALLLSREALDCRPFVNEGTGDDWASGYLRWWLNIEFLKAAFSEEEAARIVATDVDNGPDSFGVFSATLAGKPAAAGEASTRDRVFLLSAADFERCVQQEHRLCMPTPYAVSQGAAKYPYWDMCYWWLRPVGNDEQSFGVLVMSDGKVRLRLEGPDDAHDVRSVAIRPALWLDCAQS